MPLSAGDKLGPYEIVAPIGAGGMGEVWKARDTRLDRIVAIKTSSEKFSERFEREARAIAALNHPNICQIYDVGPDYIVMEYVEGTEIKGPLPLDLALKAAIQLAGALEAAHRKSITHRDLKPANILTTKSGLKVLDFGLAKFELVKKTRADETQTRALTEEGTIVGTLQYMSPEQLQGKPTDARSDIFSFGCVLYEILTGKRAFRGENQATLIAAIMDREPEPLILNQPLLARIVKKCLAKDPDDRWQSAADLKSELEWLLEAPAPIAAQQRTSARLPWVLAGLFAGVIAALLLSYALFIDRAPAPLAAVRFEIPPPEGTSWGASDFPVLSPDGSRIMFGATGRDGSRHLWIRPLDSVNAQPIPGTESLRSSPGAWSPDGRSIAYVADSTLRRMELSGGSPQILTSVPAAFTPAWGPAGIILFAGGERPLSLYQIPASGGEAKPAMASSRGFYPSFLPDGRRFLFCNSSAGGAGTNALYIGLLDSKEGKLLAAGSSGVFVPPAWLLYVRGSTLVAQSFDQGKQSLGDPIPIADQVAITENFNGGAFSVSQNGVLAYRRALPSAPNVLTWYNRQGKKLATVGEQALYSGPALSPDGKRLAVGRLDPATNTRDIWVLDLVRGVSSRLTFDKADDMNPVWSPDGSRIAFSSDRRGKRDIYWKAATGAGADELLLESGEAKALEDWSADGKLLLFNLNNTEMHAVPVIGDRKPYPVLKVPFTQVQGRLSPDGRWIAYASMESGRFDVFVQNFPPSGGKWQISKSGGAEPTWRRDGKELYFLNGTKLNAVEVTASGSSFEAGIPKELFDVETTTGRRNNFVSTADGQRFLFVTVPKSLDTTPFVVVQNWQSALKR
ncbi:MAG TPA: protein kinase [Bryobacteraceae bacterium]|nr:protein kinase [Bryobacteraceae bacterium]